MNDEVLWSCRRTFDQRGRRIPSPLAGEGGAKRRMRGSPCRLRITSYPYPPRPAPARGARRPTDAERALWHLPAKPAPRGDEMASRQVPLGRFIVDFVSFDHARLIVECDGAQHGRQSARRGARRMAALAGLRCTAFLRTNDDSPAGHECADDDSPLVAGSRGDARLTPHPSSLRDAAFSRKGRRDWTARKNALSPCRRNSEQDSK